MIISTIPVSNCTPQTIVIGRRGTYDTIQIAFDLSYLIESYGSGTAVLAVKRSQDTSAYPAVVIQEDNTLTWTVSETDTYYVGSGECQLMWYVDGGLAKTIIYPMVVMRDILSTAEEPPDGYENWIEHLTGLGAETQQNAQNAAQSASEAEQAKDDAVNAKEASEEAARKAAAASVHAPIIQNGFWYIWNDDQYVNTNVRAEGEKGDKGDTGEKGDTGNGIASITKTGTSGLVDTYTVTYTDGTSTTFTVTNGAKGDKGDTGATGNGIASIAKTGTSGNVDTYTITYTNGQTVTFTVTNGAVSSVAGKTGAVVLDSGDIEYDSTETYTSGTAGYTMSELSRHLSDVDELTFNDNLIGVQQGVYYKVDPPIKEGESFILSVADGTTLGRYVDYGWYDAEKTQLGTKRLYASTTSQVTKVSGGDVHYFYMDQKPAKFIKLERGTTKTAFTPFFQPYINYALGLNSASDYYKQRISYPDSFVNGYAMGQSGNWGSVSGNYKTTEPIWLNAGDVLHYRLCGASGDALINTYDKNGLFIESLAIGTSIFNMIEGTAVLAQDCFVVASNRFVNVRNEKTYFYVNDSIFHEVSEMVTEPEAEENTFVSGYGTLDGWQPHTEAFSKLMTDVTDAEGFMFFTDSHFMAKGTGAWEEYAQQIFAYLEKLYYSSPCSFVLHGGDWLGSGEARENFLYKLSAINGAFRRNFDRYALLVGNHECGNQSAEHTMFTHGTLAATLLANVGKTYYRFDANTFHLYCFDSWQSGAIDSFAEEQIAWFADSLTKETADHIVIAIHILHDSDALRPIGDQLTLCAKAYNSKGTYTYGNDSYDFSSATGKVAFVIAGHTHADATGVENDIPYIETVNATGYSETTFANLPLPVDLMKVDWNTGKLTAYRAARGSEGTTRELTIVV